MKASIRHRLITRFRSLRPDQWLFITGLGLLLLALGTGCRLLQGAADLPGQTVHAVTPGKKEKRTVDPVSVEQSLLRFADAYSTRMIIGIEKLRHGTNAPSSAQILKWKIAIYSETFTIATGPNAIADMLDMTIFVTVTRMALEDYWEPQIYGESAKPLLVSCLAAEQEIWQIANQTLLPEQLAELRKAIEVWHSKNALPESVLAARAVGFATQVAEASPDEASKPGSVFGLLGVDPLAGMDPAVREIAQTRLFAERALFVAQKMPMLLNWQMELLSLNATELPAVQQIVSNSTQISTSVERFAAVAENLPGQVSAEREAIFKDLDSQTRNLTPLVAEVHQTLGAGTSLSTSLNTTLMTLDEFLNHLGVYDTNSPPSPPSTNSEPFRILDYAQTAAQAESLAKQLTVLLVTLDHTISPTNLMQLSAQISPIVSHVFWRAVLLIVIILVAALIYRFVSTRIQSASRSKGNPP